jgi:hypothetical protein
MYKLDGLYEAHDPDLGTQQNRSHPKLAKAQIIFPDQLRMAQQGKSSLSISGPKPSDRR